MLNQLDNLTERVRGSNKLVDRWLYMYVSICSWLTTIWLALSLAKNRT